MFGTPDDGFAAPISPCVGDLISKWDAAGRSASVLEGLCLAHPSVAAELRSKVGVLARVDAALASAVAPLERKPDIAGYELVGLLGEGGMGTVWRAVQRSTRRNVALKLLPAHHLGSRRAQERFIREVELASRLDHSHIARLYDSGLDRGVFYFSMELIDGRPIDAHAFPSVRAALGTLIAAAHALAHAHGRGILHRDLKPSNLLVSGDHQPHLLDFGLARDLTTDSKLTLEVPFAGTPGYCSPEQARGEPPDVRGDLFSLGLIAVCILTRHHPYDLSMAPQRLLTTIASRPPALPHTHLLRQLPPDLVTVLRKSIAFDPAERYASADAFAADLQAVLDHRPVSSRRASVLYLTRRFLQRHRTAATAVAAALFLAGSVGVVVSHRILTERKRAERSAQVAAEANRFLTDLLTAASPQVHQGRNLTIRDVLDTAAQTLDHTSLDPEVEAHIRLSVGNTLGQIGLSSDLPGARAHIRRALELRTRTLGPDHPDTLQARSDYAMVMTRVDTSDIGLEMLRGVLADRQRLFGPEAAATLESARLLAVTYANHGRYDQVESVLAGYLPLVQRSSVLTPGQRDSWARVQVILSSARGNHAEAAFAFADILQNAQGRFGELHTETARAHLNLGIALLRAGDYERAREHLQTSTDLRTRIHGPDHVDTAYARLHLADALACLGQPDQSRSIIAHQLTLTNGAEEYHPLARSILTKHNLEPLPTPQIVHPQP